MLETDLHGTLAELRARGPVAWMPELGAWVVTSRALAVQVMRDAVTFTVDDPRFSTAQVLGPSMLSLDGADHARHRDPFADAFRLPEVRRTFTEAVMDLARGIVTDLQPAGRAELRRELAGPLAARVMALALDLVDVDATTLLGWYHDIVEAVSAIASGATDADRSRSAVDALAAHVALDDRCRPRRPRRRRGAVDRRRDRVQHRRAAVRRDRDDRGDDDQPVRTPPR